MNRRRTSNDLSAGQVAGLVRAWHRARADGAPLNALASFTLPAIQSLDPAVRCEAWAIIRKQVLIRLRRLGIEPTFVWTRETSRVGVEHCHFLLHVPPGRLPDVKEAFGRWIPDPRELDIIPANQATRRMSGGRFGSVVLYICKQMSPEAARDGPYLRRRGGPVIGKRAGTTRNLS